MEGLPLAVVPLVLVVLNMVYALDAYPAGALSDTYGTSRLLLLGLGTLIAADLSLAFSSGIAGSFLGIALWGAHMALTQGLFAKLVAEHAPERLRGSAFDSSISSQEWHYYSPASSLGWLAITLVRPLHLSSAPASPRPLA